MKPSKLLSHFLGVATAFAAGALLAQAQEGLVVLEGPRVGIGTTDPTAELEVSGDAKASGTFEANALAGAGNAYVCVDANGTFFRSDTPCVSGPPLSDCTVMPFSDVPVDHDFCKEIKWMAESGISMGFPDGTYRPGDPLTRQAMSAFLSRLAHLASE